MKAKYIGEDCEGTLILGKIYDVLAISIPVQKLPFLRIVDESGEDYLFPWDKFEIVEGREVFDSIVASETLREIPV